MPLRALLVDGSRDDSALKCVLESEHDIEAVVAHGFGALVEDVRRSRPDVVVMIPPDETTMLGAIETLMASQPVPILVLAQDGWSRPKAIAAGAVDAIPMPEHQPSREAELRSRIRIVSGVRTIRHIRGTVRPNPSPSRLPVVAIAASTGGPQAVVRVLHELQGLGAAVLVVQHLHPSFLEPFLEWLRRDSALPVDIAAAAEPLREGHVYLSPVNLHLTLGASRVLELDTEPATLHRPSADVLFTSLAHHAGSDAVGVVLTGMGEDGAAGLLEMRRSGARTIAQDESSSAVYGMPRAARLIGAAEMVLPLPEIAPAIVRAVAVMV